MPEDQEERRESVSFTEDRKTLETLCEFIQSIGGTIVNIKRYPPGSAIINMELDRCTKATDDLFALSPTFTLSESERMLLVDGDSLPEKVQKRAYVQGFVKSMLARNVRSMTFKEGMTREEILSFLDVLGDKAEDRKTKERLGDLLKNSKVEHISVDEKVFVVLTDGETIAKMTDLERLSRLKDSDIDAAQIKDGMFLKMLFSKIPAKKLQLTKEEIDKLKTQVNYDSLKDATDIDFQSIGPIIVKAVEKWTGADRIEASRPQGISLAEFAAQQHQADSRSRQIVQTFANISDTILQFHQPEIRAKLLNNFLSVVTNFKELTLAKILSAKLAQDENIDLKDQILNQISLTKKSKVIDIYLRKYNSLANGLSADDFEMNLEEFEESEKILQKILKVAASQNRSDLADKIHKVLGIHRKIRREGETPGKLLILKMKRLFAKGAEFYIQDEFLENFPEIVSKLTEHNRLDILRKIIEKGGTNFDSENTEHRLATINAFIRIQQELISLSRFDLLIEGYNVMVKQLRKEPETPLFMRILATMVMDFGRLTELGDFHLASNILRMLQRLPEESENEQHKAVLAEALKKLTEEISTMDKLLAGLESENERESDEAAKLLQQFNREAVLAKILHLLKTSEEMRIRKKCISFIGRYEKEALPILTVELSKNNPWYFNRNIINLMAETGDEQVVSSITGFLTDQDERVQKAAIAAMTKIGGPVSNEALAETFESQPESIRKSLVQHFGQARVTSAVPKLISLLKGMTVTEKNEPFAITIIQALGQIGDADCTTTIGSFLKKGGGLRRLFSKQNDNMVAAAITALGKIGDPSTAGSVKKFIRHSNPRIAKAAQDSMRALKSES